MDVDLSKDSLAMWVVGEAIKDEYRLMDQFDFSRGTVHDIKFTVDGVELNFINVINRIDEIHEDMVTKAAGKMYTEGYDQRADEIKDELDKISRRLKEIRRLRFPEVDWGDDW